MWSNEVQKNVIDGSLLYFPTSTEYLRFKNPKPQTVWTLDNMDKCSPITSCKFLAYNNRPSQLQLTHIYLQSKD